MAILVVCPGCRKRFQVSDQFAGRTGPCPSCKTAIKIPGASEQVVVHEPDQYAGAGKTRTGEMVLKPIAREDTKFNPVAATIIGSIAVVVLIAAFAGRGLLRGDELMHRALQTLGLLLVSPPLVVAGYSFLRNDELEPYRGKELYLRAGILSLAYTILWGIFGLTAIHDLVATGELWMWMLIAPPFVIIGGLGALATLDLEFGNGVLHYAFYLVATMILGWAAGLGWPWQVAAPTLV